jgi:hypothetical protein
VAEITRRKFQEGLRLVSEPPVVNPKGRIGCSFEEEAIPWPAAAKPKKKSTGKGIPFKRFGDSDDFETDDVVMMTLLHPPPRQTQSVHFLLVELNESALQILQRRVSLTSQSHAGIGKHTSGEIED